MTRLILALLAVLTLGACAAPAGTDQQAMQMQPPAGGGGGY